jgi:hypothetical protein
VTAKAEQLFDVVVYEIATRQIESLVGESMRWNKGHYNAQKRLETVIPRLNDRYAVSIVPAGKYKVGDVMKEAGK